MLDRRTFLVKERVAIVKLTDVYDIFDPETGQVLGVAREEPPGWAKYARLLVDKRLLPTAVRVYEGDPDAGASPFLTIRKGAAFLRPRIDVLDARGEKFGQLVSKLLSIGGAFTVSDASGTPVAEVKGDWKGWNFQFLRDGREIGVVTKKWGGLGKELFTSADTYVISLTDEVGGREAAALLLAAGLSIDVVLKERS
ncbi:MAG: oxidoreductase [Thermoleophilia bacterium]|nr:oxidoreductase [Thermoleophilia bacterium]